MASGQAPSRGLAEESEIYDRVVLRASNTQVWRCPVSAQLALYDENVRGSHLDVGPGSGYFLDNCRFPVALPSITLLDRDPAMLERVRRRIARYRPRAVVADVCEPLPDPGRRFRSIGFNYVLHCLPDESSARMTVFRNLRMLLAPGGSLFGSTILGQGVPHTPVSRRVNEWNNRTGVFHNRNDSPERLESTLRQFFDGVEVSLRGCVALFTARLTAPGQPRHTHPPTEPPQDDDTQ